MASPSLLQRFQGSLLGAAMAPETRPWVQRFEPTVQWLLHPQPLPGLDLAHCEAIDRLPLWLYSHENWHHRHQWVTMLDLPPQTLALDWAFGETLALILKGYPADGTLPGAIIDRWTAHALRGGPEMPEVWRTQLQQFQGLFPSPNLTSPNLTSPNFTSPSLAALRPWLALQPLSYQPFLGALYLLLTCAGSAAAALDRSGQIPNSTAWSGAFVGAFLGSSGLPLRSKAEGIQAQAQALFLDWMGCTTQARIGAMTRSLNPT
jgi:hypothetical protein